MIAVLAVAAADGSWQPFLLAIALLGELLAVVFVYRVLVRGGSPSSTLLWMLVILAAPWIGLLLYYLLPRRLQLRRLRRLRVRGARLREVRPRSRGAGEPPAARRGLAALLAGADGSGLVGGNALVWLPSGDEFLQRAEQAIRAARRHVHCTVYIFRPDQAGLRFLALLTAAARAGVTVRLLYDSIGSFGLKARHLAELRAAGGCAEPFLPLLWKRRPFTMNLRNHRKLLVVDGEVGFTGGRNVGDEYFTDRFGQQRRWLDAMVELRGPAVDRLQDVFVEDWCTATEEVLADTFVPAVRTAGDTAVGIVCSGPDREESDLWYAVVQAIGEAVTSVELSSPYLVPPPTLLFALQLASARGVRVRVYTNGPATEAAVLYHAQRSHYRRLLEAEVEIYETVREYNHAKLLVVDARTVVVGSANMDLRSANLNFELAAVAIDATALAAEVQATIDRRRADFRRITVADLPVRPWARAIDGICGLFSPLL
ncbi:MAG: phospholipase D-like domain-containing protein [Planctomycetes bacterium]|nr:phospholipase D-like domain-containing protein [Planctomycetota bacterium]